MSGLLLIKEMWVSDCKSDLQFRVCLKEKGFQIVIAAAYEERMEEKKVVFPEPGGKAQNYVPMGSNSLISLIGWLLDCVRSTGPIVSYCLQM